MRYRVTFDVEVEADDEAEALDAAVDAVDEESCNHTVEVIEEGGTP
jgi:hypothetical protein